MAILPAPVAAHCGPATPFTRSQGLDTVTYTAIGNIQDTSPTEHEVEVADVVRRLTTHQVVPAKEAAGLYSFCRFSEGGGRKATHATYVDAIVLDFDNTVVERIPGQGGMNLKKTQTRVATPVTPQAVEAMLRAANIRSVVVTSHNHKPDWPKFRVIVFCDDSIPAGVYNDIVGEFLAYTGLGSPAFAAGLDRSCLQENRFYYWPTHDQAGAPYKYAAYVDGDNYELTDTVLKAPTPKSGRSSAGGQAIAAGMWTSQQIHAYYRYAVPNLTNHTAKEAKACCPIHGGANPRNFCVDLSTGFWHCFSECAANGLRGGGIYAFHWHWRNAQLRPQDHELTYHQAKDEVHLLIGRPVPSSVAKYQQMLAAPTPQLTPQEATVLVQCINALPIVEREEAVAVLHAAHPAIPQAVIQEHVMLQRPAQDASSPTDDSPGMTRAQRIRQEFNTRINTITHDLKSDGVYVLKLVGTGESKRTEAFKIAPVPMWVSRAGYDAATNTKWYLANWRDGAGKEYSVWATMDDLISKSQEVFTNNPVSLPNRFAISDYFCEHITEFDKDLKCENVSTRFGWQPVRMPDNSQSEVLVLYAADAVRDGGEVTVVVPPMLETKGTLGEWVALLRKLAEAPFEDFKCLWAALGLCAAAPLPHLLNVRNPILYLAGPTSRGKSTIANVAVGLWGDPKKLQVGANSTAKGIEDKVLECQDLPFLAEEFQRKSQNQKQGLTHKDAEDAIYALANGIRRVTSDKNKHASGGEVRKGVNLILSEEVLTSQFAKGAGARILTLKASEFVPSRAWSQDVLNPFISENYGALGPELQAAWNKSWRIIKADYIVFLKQLSTAGEHFTGDDLPAIAMIAMGLQMLQRIAGLPLPVQQTAQYLMQTVAPSRTTLRDELNWEDSVFVDLVTSIENANWGEGGVGMDFCANIHGPVAARGAQLMYPDRCALEIIMDSSVVRSVIQRGNVKNQKELASEWMGRGYLMRDESRGNAPYKIRRTNVNGINANDFRGEGAHVYCVTLEGMKFAQAH